jgi:catechol 2,3-dioxygenase-like lactoylglutathione lyase family enzyme
MLDHVSIQCDDAAASARFYDAALGAIGATRVMEYEENIGYGFGDKPSFWIAPRTDEIPNRQFHVAFVAPDRASVRAFVAVAVVQGLEVLHEPKEWPEYHPGYYGGFVRDPDGNNVEAVCHVPE